MGMMDCKIWDEELDDMYRFSFRDNFYKTGLFNGWYEGARQQSSASSMENEGINEDNYDYDWLDAFSRSSKRRKANNNEQRLQQQLGKSVSWSTLGKTWLQEVMGPKNNKQVDAISDKKEKRKLIESAWDVAYKNTTWGHFYQHVDKLDKLVSQISSKPPNVT